MREQPARTFSSDFKRFFLRGLVVLLPSILTLWLVVQAYRFIDASIAEPVNQGVRQMLAWATPRVPLLQRQFEPTDEAVAATVTERTRTEGKPPDGGVVRADLRRTQIARWWASKWYLDLIGLIIAVISVYIAGRLLGGFLGRRIYWRLEELITRIPVLKQIYPSVKQVVDFLFSDDRSLKFSRVVILQYPRQGLWSLGFVTGDSMRSIIERAGDAVSVFIPSSPTPFTGYTITVPRQDVIEVQVTVDEALRYIVSGGVLVPPSQQMPPRMLPGVAIEAVARGDPRQPPNPG